MTEAMEIKVREEVKKEKTIKKISSGIDFIKAVAVFFVVCVHFFLHSGFYQQQHSAFTMIFWGGIRNIFFLCVPLFLITTGYLQRKKTVTKKFYMGIIPILSSYFFIALISILFKVFYLGQTGDFLYFLYSITNFSANNYAWYVCMFTGLYLLIPFLNGAYNSLTKKNHKYVLIAVLFLISSVVSFNFYHTCFNQGSYMFNEYWTSLYPFLYYFIGAFIGEYKNEITNKIKKRYFLIMFLISVFVQTFYIFIRQKNGYFPATFFGEYNSVFVVVSATLLFLTLFNIDIKNSFFKKLLRSISKNTLEIYLFSFIFDTVIYGYFSKYFASFSAFNNYAFVFVVLSFVLSYICALIKEGLFFCFKKALKQERREKSEISSNI